MIARPSGILSISIYSETNTLACKSIFCNAAHKVKIFTGIIIEVSRKIQKQLKDEIQKRINVMIDKIINHIKTFKMTPATILILSYVFIAYTTGAAMGKKDVIPLPQPDTIGAMTLEQTLLQRRSIRNFKDATLSLKQISQLLWSVQGITDIRGYRTAPSAGALYPIEVYVIAGKVNELSPGIYKYLPEKHEIKIIKTGDFRNDLYAAALNQSPILQAPTTILFSGIFKRITGKYGKRGIQYAFIEAGHAGQNLLLESISLGLGTVPIGAFDDADVSRILGFNEDETPMYLFPVGIPQKP
jgi:SagB-type dehydrogenase family enzyme